MDKKKHLLLVIAVVPIFLVTSYSMTFSAPPAKPFVLKAGSVYETGAMWDAGLRIFSEMVAKESKGELTVKYIGGEETFPMFELIEILRKGVVDLVCADATFYTKFLPEVFTSIISEMNPEEERKSGYFDAINKLHQKKINAVYMGKTTDFGFNFYLKEPRDKPDFKGLKLRVLPHSLNLVKVMGGSPIVVAPPELYSALEKGVVDGIAFPLVGITERRLQEVLKYIYDHSYYKVSVHLMTNLDAWNKLPPHLQKLVTDIMPRVEQATCAQFAKWIKQERALLIREGLKYVTWSPSDVKKFQEMARKAGIKELKRVSPDHGPELIKMVTK